MQQTQYLRIVFGFDALVNDLEHALNERLNQPLIEESDRTVLLEQRLAVAKMGDKVGLLKYADADDFPASLTAGLEKLVRDVERLRAGTAVRRGSKAHDFWQEIKRADENIYSIIHPLEVVGKWPPDTAPR